MEENVIEDMRKRIYDYLQQQKELELADIEANSQLTDEEKVEAGLLIKDAQVVKVCDNQYELHTTEDNTKLRVGDSVRISNRYISANAKIIDLYLEGLSIETPAFMKLSDLVDIEVMEHMMLDPMLDLLDGLREGCPGYSFLNLLAGKETPRSKGLGAIDVRFVKLPNVLNTAQRSAVTDCLKRPSVYCLQGPPGTGKTAVLSAIAQIYATMRKEVLVISNTHQAVNNALNKIAEQADNFAVVKIGEKIKGEGLNKKIITAGTYNHYLAYRKNSKKRMEPADVVGMTLHAAIINLGLRNSGFKPKIVLGDEAGQMPLPYASLIGAFGCGSIIFIGDDKQMPPIFHPQLSGNPLSVSIFEYLCGRYPALRHPLNITYRMNDEITAFVSQNFYESDEAGVKLVSADSAKDRRLNIEGISQEPIQVVEVPLQKSDLMEMECDVNVTEAEQAVELARIALQGGLSLKDIAIVTPYRRQVKCIRSLWKSKYPDEAMPLINTVECLQGQDVEMIIISLVLNARYGNMEAQLPFVLEKHRLNVMISRAKCKVILLMSTDLNRCIPGILK